jgi:hypothetical protein
MVSLRGKVFELEAAEGHFVKLAKKYLGKDIYPGRSPGKRE